MTTLSSELKPIYDLEIDLGNQVVRIDAPAGSNCPYAVIFASPLHLEEIKTRLELSSNIRFWEARDPHYAAEHGFVCDLTHHAIAGPMK